MRIRSKDYEIIQRSGGEAAGNATNTIAGLVQHAQPGALIFNGRSWSRRGVVELPWQETYQHAICRGEESQALRCQIVERDGQKSLLVEVDPVPAYGYRFISMEKGHVSRKANRLHVDKHHLENDLVRVRLNAMGQIESLVLKSNQREMLPTGQAGNVLQIFEDRPLSGEAWEIDIFYQEKFTELGVPDEWVVEESGPLRCVIRLQWNFNQSVIKQRMVMHVDSARIDFVTELDWHEQHVLLKAAFPVDVRAKIATYDVGFGSLERPTHWNTPFDAAHFENPAHQWVDLSEEGYGAALLNDCKYGYDVKDTVMRLSLHRSPTEPDPDADQGIHHFTYSILPHEGDWRKADVIQAAHDLNDPLKAHFMPANPAGKLPEAWGFYSSPDQHVILDTVKPAEDGDGTILRFFESHGVRNPGFTCNLGRALLKVVECNLLEEETGSVDFRDDQISFPVKPFMLKTLKVWFA